MTETEVIERSAATVAGETDLDALSEQVTALTKLVELLTQDQVEMSEKIETLEVALASSSNGDELVFQPTQDVATTSRPALSAASSTSEAGFDDAAEENTTTLDDASDAIDGSPIATAADDAFIMQNDDAPSLGIAEAPTGIGDAAMSDSDEAMVDPIAGPEFIGPPAPTDTEVDHAPTLASEDVISGAQDGSIADSMSENIFVEDTLPDDLTGTEQSPSQTPPAEPISETLPTQAQPNPLEALEERMMTRITEITPPKEMIEALSSKLDRLNQTEPGGDSAIANFESVSGDILERLETLATQFQQTDQASSDTQTTEKLAELFDLVNAQKTAALKRHEVVEIFKDMQGEFLDDLRHTIAELTASGQDTGSELAG